MALSDSPIGAEYPSRRRGLGEASKGKLWSDAQKIECVTMWLATGNLRLTAATLGIPEITARKWRATQWWKEIADEIQLQDRLTLSATAKNIINKSLEVVADRLELGDWIYDQKTGEMRRKPVAMKDALQAANSMIDQKIKLDKTDTTDKSTEGVEQRLEKLMQKFEALAAPRKPEVVDVIYVQEENDNAENENGSEREESSRLQLRQGVRSDTDTGEESDGSEQSEVDS